MFTRVVHPRSGLSIVAGMMLLAILACNLPGERGAAPTPVPPDVIYTQAAQTLQVQLTEKARESMPEEPLAPIQPTSTHTPIPPTQPSAASPTPTLTATLAFTPTPVIPKISASVNTNCRKGPSKLYDPPVGVLAVGQESEVHGKKDDGSWWYIRNPNKPDTFCWVWAETTSVTGDTSQLPVITPPPSPPTPTFTATPGPTFTLSFSNVHNCGGTPTAILEVSNTGGADLDSLRLKIEDLTASVTLFGPDTSDAPFMGASGECPPGGDILKAGKTLFIGGAIGGGNSGHDAKAIVKLCTENGLGGTCVEQSLEFEIP